MASTYLFDYRSNVKLNKWWKEHCKTVTRYVTVDTCTVGMVQVTLQYLNLHTVQESLHIQNNIDSIL